MLVTRPTALAILPLTECPSGISVAETAGVAAAIGMNETTLGAAISRIDVGILLSGESSEEDFVIQKPRRGRRHCQLARKQKVLEVVSSETLWKEKNGSSSSTDPLPSCSPNMASFSSLSHIL
jgi:hypothetical protein